MTMKKFITLFALVISTGAIAQNLSTWGLSGNADNLVQNPGADPMTSFQLRYVGIQTNAGLNMTAGQILGTSDLLGNIIGSGVSNTDFSLENNIVGPHLGIKLGKNYIFAGIDADFNVSAQIDNDLVSFLRYGMADASGIYDPNYNGDFSDLGINIQLNQTTYFGYQRSLLDNKLRLGATYSLHNNITSLNVNATNFNINSSSTAGIPNSLEINYDVDIAGGFDFNNIDSLSNLGGINTAQAGEELLENWLENPLGSLSSSFGFGLTYKPLNMIEVSLSMSGLNSDDVNFSSITSKVWSGSSTIDGFEYTSQAGASVSDEVGDAVDQYTESLTGSIGDVLTNGNYQQALRVAQNTNAAANFYLTKRSYLGAHYTARSNSFRDYQYVGLNGLLWLGRNLQLKGGYYLSLDENQSDIINAAVQFRVTPLLQIYVGSNSIGDIATVTNSLLEDQKNLQIGASTSGINISAGVSFTLFDSRFKAEKNARKEAKSAEKAKDATGLTPAQQQKVEDAAENSGTKK